MGSISNAVHIKAEKIAIIGAGPTGIAVAKYLHAEQAFSQISIFEQRSNVGGLWNYLACDRDQQQDLEVPQTNPHAGHEEPVVNDSISRQVQFMSPIYDRLETNIPRGLMGFSDLDWSQQLQLFPKHDQVLEYIERYADDVRHMIQFETQVLDVRPIESGQWILEKRNLSQLGKTTNTNKQTFDAVVVANGHFNVPYIPSVPGIEDWTRAFSGSITHSKFYRAPEQYADQKVIIVGNSASGIDIGSQIRTTCKTPLISSSRSDSYLQVDPPPHQLDKPKITQYDVANRTVTFADGTRESDIDAVLYCTGYFYNYPFLTSLDPPLTTTGERVQNLYQHIFYRPRPTLVFPALNQKVIPFPVSEAQGAVIARVFAGRLALPSDEEMRRWEEETMRAAGGDAKSFHVLKFPKDGDYINMLHDWALSADRNVHGKGAGKEPPFWGEVEYWTRERFPAIKKAFQGYGEERSEKRTLENVGFSFGRWKAEQVDERQAG